MTKGRLFYAKINTAAMFVKEIVALLCNFILPRVIIGSFGSNYNGLISSITQFLNFVSILRIGIAGAARFSMYKHFSANDNGGLSSTVNAFQQYMFKTGIIVGIYVIAFAFCYPVLFAKDFGFLEVFPFVLIIGSTVITQYLFGIVSANIFEAAQKSYVVHIVDILSSIAVAAITCVLVLGGFPLIVVKMICAAFLMVPPIFLFIFSRCRFHIDRKAPPDKSALKRKNDVMFHSIANIVYGNVDIFALTVLATKGEISIYSVYALIVGGLLQIISIFTSSLESSFGNMFAQNETENIRKQLHNFEFLSFGCSGVLFSVAFLLILPFVKLYVGGVADINYVVPSFGILIVLAALVYSIRTPYQTVVQAGGFYRETKWFPIIEALINLVVSLLCVHFFGLPGVAVGTLFANVFRMVSYSLFCYKKVIKEDIGTLAKKGLWLLLIFFTSFCALRPFASFAYRGWLQWIGCGFSFTLFAAVAALLLAFVFIPEDLIAFKELIVGRRRRNV